MNKRKEQKQQSHTSVVEAAARSIRKKGMTHMSVSEVMAEAGLTVGGFYSHFKDKDELIELSFKKAMEEVAKLMEKAATQNSNLQPLEAVIRYYLSEDHRETPSAGCPLPSVLAEAAFTDIKPKKRKLFSEAIMTMKARLLGVAKTKVNEDEIFALIALMVGGQILARATKCNDVSDLILESCRNWAIKNYKGGLQ